MHIQKWLEGWIGSRRPADLRARLRCEQLDERAVPASLSFQLSNGVTGSGSFTMPTDGVNPALATQSIAIPDLTVTIAGDPFVNGTFSALAPTADFEFGVFVGVTGSVSPSPFVTYNLEDGVVNPVGMGWDPAPIVYDAAETELSFTLDDGIGGTISYDIPWDSVDATQSSQSLPLSNFQLTIAGQVFTDATADFTTLPTVQFAKGVFTGVTFAIDTSGVAGFPYTDISMSGTTVSAQQPPEGLPPVAPPPRTGSVNVRATIILDFSTARTGLSYRIDLLVKDTNGNTLVSGPINIGDGATTQDIRDGIAAALGDSGLEVVTTGDNKVRIQSKGAKKLGAITYDTFILGAPAPNLAGPQVSLEAGTATLTVNGTPIHP